MKKPFLSAVTRQRIKNMIAYVLDHAEQLNQSSFPASEAGADPANVYNAQAKAFLARWQYILDNDGGDIVRA
jgi:hypothetical protein